MKTEVVPTYLPSAESKVEAMSPASSCDHCSTLEPVTFSLSPFAARASLVTHT